MSQVIGLDLGTTNVKAVVVSAGGEIVAAAAREVMMQSPRPGWAEQESSAIWEAVCAVLRDVSGDGIDGLCISAAMHSVMPVAADGSPLAPAMTWADTRCADEERAIHEAYASLYATTGCPAHTTYHPARLLWLRKHAPSAARYVSIKDWILFRLTGQWATDHGYASTMGLLDIHQKTWCEAAMRIANVDPAQLCPLVASNAIVGNITPDAARQTGLAASVQVFAGSSDGALAQIGAGAISPQQTIITVGTSGAIRRTVHQPQLDPLQRAWCYVLDEHRWLAGGAINNAGLLLKWVKHTFWPELKGEDPYRTMIESAEGIEPGAGGVVILPYLTGERCPHYRSDAACSIHGLELRHDRRHITRAALEAVAFCLADVAECVPLRGEVRLTGGITRYAGWMQIVSDVLGTAVHPMEAADASAVGAAMVGHAGLGRRSIPPAMPGPAVKPDAARHERYLELHRWFQGLWREGRPGPR